MNDETDEADEAENEAATFTSVDAFIWIEFLVASGEARSAGGGVALLPKCESTVEWGLMMRSDADEDDDESMLIVLFELVGENCWS